MRVNEPLVKPALSIKRVLVRRRTVFESAAVSRCGCSNRRRRQKSPDQLAGLMCTRIAHDLCLEVPASPFGPDAGRHQGCGNQPHPHQEAPQ